MEASGDTQVALQLLLFLPTLIPEIGQQDDAYNVVIWFFDHSEDFLSADREQLVWRPATAIIL